MLCSVQSSSSPIADSVMVTWTNEDNINEEEGMADQQKGKMVVAAIKIQTAS